MATCFEEEIVTHQRLRELSKQPSTRANNKIINHIDDICRRFIAACPFVIVASRGADGRIDLSPKGDPPGFVAVLDDTTLAIPDRPGNHRLDTFDNLLTYPDIGLLFLIPGNGGHAACRRQGQNCSRPRFAGQPCGRRQAAQPRARRHRRAGLHALSEMRLPIATVDSR